MGDQAQRIVELIEARDKIDVSYVQEMQFDQVSLTARVVDQLSHACQAPACRAADGML